MSGFVHSGVGVAGDSTTRARADLFDLLLADGPCCLTAISRVSWSSDVGKVDRVLFHLADGRDRASTCSEFGLSESDLDAILTRANEPELFRIR